MYNDSMLMQASKAKSGMDVIVEGMITAEKELQSSIAR